MIAVKARELIGRSLTAREHQVLYLVSQGSGTKQIATALGISDHTTKFHMRNMLLKLGARTRAHAVAIGFSRGLLTTDRGMLLMGEPAGRATSELPPRKEWDAEGHDRGDRVEESAYVDGWNEALDEVERLRVAP